MAINCSGLITRQDFLRRNATIPKLELIIDNTPDPNELFSKLINYGNPSLEKIKQEKRKLKRNYLKFIQEKGILPKANIQDNLSTLERTEYKVKSWFNKHSYAIHSTASALGIIALNYFS